MRLLFYDKTEQEVDIVTDVLSSYGISYKIITRKQKQGIFDVTFIYDVEVDIEKEFYDYLNKEINAKIKAFNDLQDNRHTLEHIYNKESSKDNKAKDFAQRRFEKAMNFTNHFGMPSLDMFTSLFKNEQEESDSEYIAFNDLPEVIQETIKQQIPKEVIKNSTFHVAQTKDGLVIKVNTIM